VQYGNGLVFTRQKVNSGGRTEPDIPAPDRPVPDPGTRYDAMQIFQTLTEIQKDLTSIGTKTERLITDVNGLNGRVDQIRISLSTAKGFGIAAMILIPACAAVIWWLIGAKLETLRNQLLNASERPAHTQTINPNSPGG